jgi:hypothetical protein
MRTILFLTFLILTLFGCQKKSDVFMFDCVVFDEKVDAPVAGASVVMKVQNAAGGFNPVYVTVGTGTTMPMGGFISKWKRTFITRFGLRFHTLNTSTELSISIQTMFRSARLILPRFRLNQKLGFLRISSIRIALKQPHSK